MRNCISFERFQFLITNLLEEQGQLGDKFLYGHWEKRDCQIG